MLQTVTNLREIVESAIAALSRNELIRLRTYADLLIRLHPRDGAETSEDLLQETLLRILSGERRWIPESVPFFHFFLGCMRSIASSWRKRSPRSAPDYADPFTELSDTQPALIASNEPDAERELSAKEELEHILSQFKPGDRAAEILHLWMEGSRGDEVARTLGMTEREYHTTVKRIRRTVARRQKWR